MKARLVEPRYANLMNLLCFVLTTDLTKVRLGRYYFSITSVTLKLQMIPYTGKTFKRLL